MEHIDGNVYPSISKKVLQPEIHTNIKIPRNLIFGSLCNVNNNKRDMRQDHNDEGEYFIEDIGQASLKYKKQD